MIYRSFGRRLGWNVSAIGMGTWNIGNQWGEIDDVTSWATVRAAFEAGMNLYDTAEAYGTEHGLSEERLGVALAGLRHRVYLVSKIGHYGKRSGQAVPKTTADMIRLCAHAILHRLRTDWVDVMLCHEDDITDPSIYLEAFESLKKQGKIRAHGISTDSLDVLKRYNADGLADAVEVNYSLLNRAAEQSVLPYCLEHGMGVLIRGPWPWGYCSGRYSAQSVFTDSIREKWHRDEGPKARFLAQVAKVEKLKKVLSPGADMVTAALRFMISHAAAPVAIPGAKSPEQARMNATAGEQTLTNEEIGKLLEAIG